ncbi:MAG: hypothetical protein IJ809_05150 [Clostridia bacterium]|nr:hypothetical protein [Clostridia bacterium]
MNKDYLNQESTEEYTEKILKNDTYLNECLKEDGILLNEIANFKQYSIVDIDRPYLCADRLDGVILTGISWTKNINKDDILNIVNDIDVYNGEIGFKSNVIASKVVNVSKSIDVFCHSNEDNYMMELLASITKHSIDSGYISYDDLYVLNEDELFEKMKNSNDTILMKNLDIFKNIKLEDVPNFELKGVKIRDLNPLVKGVRII